MANFNFNKVILGGKLTDDPEIKTTTNGVSVVSFTVAVNRKYSKDKNEADFINCTAWRQTAEFIARYFKKASSICLVGSIQTRKWTDKDGRTRTAQEVVVDEAMFVDGKNDSLKVEPKFEEVEGSFDEAKIEPISETDDLPF